MNYNISGIDMMFIELSTMFDTAKVEIKKEHQLLMVSETTSFKKGLGSTLGFFTRAATDLFFHEVSLLALALRETSSLTNHQKLMLLLDFYFRGVKHHE